MHSGSPRSAARSRSRWLQAAMALGLLALIGSLATPAGAINCYTEKMRTEPHLLLGAQGPGARSDQSSPPAGPPPNPGVGDTWNWYLWYFGGGPPHAEYKPCTVRGMGQNVYVIVNDADWNVWVHQADVDQIVRNWDNSSYGNWPNEGIYQLDTEHFGPAPDRLDHDPRIYVVLYDWDVTGADGYFNSDDEDTTAVTSNRCECVYVDASTSQPGGPSGAYLTAVMAHEFTHMIQWNADPFEAAWVDEGQAELAMWFYGHPDPITGFPTNPDNNLTNFTGNFADYIKGYLFSMYFWEHYGGTPSLLAWVANPQISLTGV